VILIRAEKAILLLWNLTMRLSKF